MTKLAARYLLDTNIVSYLPRQHQGVTRKVINTALENMAISAITEGELRFGIARTPEAKKLKLAVNEIIIRFDVLAWDSSVSQAFGTLKAKNQAAGKSLTDLDMLIAAHAVATNRILVSSDLAFMEISGLKCEN